MKLTLTAKEKEIASRASKIAAARPNDDFWQGVQKEVDRLEKKPAIKPRALK